MWRRWTTQSVYWISPRNPSIPFPPLRGGRGRPLPLTAGSLVLDPHRHDDAEVACVGAILGIAHALRILVLELEADALGVDRAQELRQVVGVDAEAELGAVVLAR